MTAMHRLYELLPDFIRFRDQLDPDRGEPLRALMDVLGHPYDLVHKDIQGLYRNWFIETCDDWVIPYIGDLIGVRGLTSVPAGCHSRRALVANTIAYRRRKGTKAALAGVARDASGWPTYVREMSRSLARTQNLSRYRPGEGGTLDLRDRDGLELIGTPFDHASYSIDTRRPNLGVGETLSGAWRRPRANLPNLGVYYWRLKAYPVDRGTPCSLGGGLFTFDPFGRDVPLFNQPAGSAVPFGETTEADLPAPLRIGPLARELEARVAGRRATTNYFGAEPVFEIRIGRLGRVIRLADLEIRDLSNWNLGEGGLEGRPKVAVDPVRGRLAFPGGVPARVRVSYSYGFGGDVGGGSYERRDSLTDPRSMDLLVSVDCRYQPSEVGPAPGDDRVLRCRSLEAAFDAMARESASRVLVRIEDSATYELPDTVAVKLDARAELRVEAADGQRPCLRGGFAVDGAGGGEPALLVVNGIWLEGSINVKGHVRVEVLHSSLNPSVGFALEASGSGVEVSVTRSLLGPIGMAEGENRLLVRDSVIDGFGGSAVDSGGGPGPTARVLSSTVLGGARFAALTEADSALFAGEVVLERPWDGLEARTNSYGLSQDAGQDEVLPGGEVAAGHRRPTFTSTTPGQPGYAQPASRNPEAILYGGLEGAEMGVFHHLCDNHRASGLAEIVNEYVPWGMETWLERVT